VNAQRIHRLHREEGLAIRPEVPGRKRAWRHRQGRPAVAGPNERWAMDLVSGQPFDGRPSRVLVVIDVHARGALAAVPGAGFRAFRVVEVLGRPAAERGRPASSRVDDGPGFAGRMLDRWAYLNRVEIDPSRPGRPADDAFAEAFDARLRAECLNACWFRSMADAGDRIGAWRADYNEEGPHAALGA
jgi:putative transposase